MPRPNRGAEGLIGAPCKIRKRGCSSSSSSSSILQNYRFKRAILVAKRGGSSTPVPTWKMSSRSPASLVVPSESPKYPPSQAGAKAKQAPVSARKLAATLWELNEIPSPRMMDSVQENRGKKETRGRERVARSVQSGSLPPHLSDPSHSPVSEAMDRSGTSSLRRRVSAVTHRIRSSERQSRGLDSTSNTSLMEIETRSRVHTPSGSVVGMRSRLKDVSNGLTTSKELLKILNRVWGLEEQHSSSISLVQALRMELERARMQVDQLIQEQKSDRDEINYLMKKFSEEKAAWKSKEQERIRAAIESIAGDLEVERKLRKRTESLNVKLSRELGETKASLSKAVKELEGEKRAREIMEQVCDELARGIGEDKAQAEELKRESAKVLAEVEKEREMLQLADVWREERVQMKLSEAKYQFEEKNAAVDKLRSELEAFLESKKTNDMGNGYRHSRDQTDGESGDDEGEVDNDKAFLEGEEDGEADDDSGESDLHSIELNMDNNCKGYKWSYALNGENNTSVEDEHKGRRSASEKISRSLERSLSEGIEWEFTSGNYRNQGERTDPGRLSESSVVSEKQSKKDDHNNKSIKGLRDHFLSNSRIGSAQGFASPTRQWNQHRPPQDPIEVAREKLKVAEMVKGMRESSLKSRLVEKGEFMTSRQQKQIAPKQ
ncbi:hypothetical protein H6P81_013465 [Aristolochia fimbriata]|uniref:Uncharacterized protein n=1 Tax=Aristolochia fimbriata TaxID=158543 RepID=A0AAV7EES7_ARIFI|nr:hypothetical protein H6P81_013465 [Aristolochia fimbriata]